MANDPPTPKGTIFNSSGDPVGKPPANIDDFNLEPGTQALIETRLNSAIDQLRVQNSEQLKKLSEDHARRWRITAIFAIFTTVLGFAWGIFTWFYAPSQIRDWVDEYVKKKITEPEMKAALSEAAKKEADVYVQSQIDPLRKSASELRGQITSLKADAEKLADDVKIQKWSLSAKAGDLSSYEHLNDAARHSSDTSLANVLKRDVDEFFDEQRYSFTQHHFNDPVTKQQFQLSVEEAFQFIGSADISAKEAGANCIGDVGRKSSVASLIDALTIEQNLRVISRMTFALETITKDRFAPLDKAGALEWWKTKAQNPEYHFPNDAFGLAFGPIESEATGPYKLLASEGTATASIPRLRKVLEGEPVASQTRFFLILALLRINDVDGAEKELAPLATGQPRYWLIPVAKAAVMMGRKKTDDAVVQLNGFIQQYPTVSSSIRLYWVFEPLGKDTRVKWPAGS